MGTVGEEAGVVPCFGREGCCGTLIWGKVGVKALNHVDNFIVRF